ncbi:MAG: hypothetical protein ABWK05_03710 [Pyrobaculum sp.]
MKICVTSASKGGTGKTTFAEVFTYILKTFGISASVVRPQEDARVGVKVVDFPAFPLSDKTYLKKALTCDWTLYVVDEDEETLRAVEIFHVMTRPRLAGVVLNKVIRRPSKYFTTAYKRLAQVYVIRFDENLAVHKSIGVPPYRVRSPAVLDMAKTSVDLVKKLKF